jgi:hypothetical protein
VGVRAGRRSQRRDDRGRRKKLTAAVAWSLEWGEQLEWLQALADDDPTFMPQALSDRPEVPAELAFYLGAFWALSGDRQSGWSIGPIPFAAVDAYARRYGVAGLDAFDRLNTLVGRMDVVFMKWEPRKIE